MDADSAGWVSRLASPVFGLGISVPQQFPVIVVLERHGLIVYLPPFSRGRNPRARYWRFLGCLFLIVSPPFLERETPMFDTGLSWAACSSSIVLVAFAFFVTGA